MLSLLETAFTEPSPKLSQPSSSTFPVLWTTPSMQVAQLFHVSVMLKLSSRRPSRISSSPTSRSISSPSQVVLTSGNPTMSVLLPLTLPAPSPISTTYSLTAQQISPAVSMQLSAPKLTWEESTFSLMVSPTTEFKLLMLSLSTWITQMLPAPTRLKSTQFLSSSVVLNPLLTEPFLSPTSTQSPQ